MILLPLLAAHFMGDWVVQTDWQANHKVWPQQGAEDVISFPTPTKLTQGQTLLVEGERMTVTQSTHTTVGYVSRPANYWHSWRAMAQHMLGYHLGVLVACLLAGLGWKATVVVAVSLTTHTVLDRRWTVKWLMCHTGSVRFSENPGGVIAVDQALHLSILCVLAAVFG